MRVDSCLSGRTSSDIVNGDIRERSCILQTAERGDVYYRQQREELYTTDSRERSCILQTAERGAVYYRQQREELYTTDSRERRCILQTAESGKGTKIRVNALRWLPGRVGDFL